MARILTDAEITELLAKEKNLPSGWRARLKLKEKPGAVQLGRELEIEARSGESFIIRCRKNKLNPLDFSVMLFYADGGNEYRLLRCNGKPPSGHTNCVEKLAGDPNYAFGMEFHVHCATQRYQEADRRIDGFAVPTQEYSDYATALEYFMKRTRCIDPDGEPEGPLLGMMGGTT